MTGESTRRTLATVLALALTVSLFAPSIAMASEDVVTVDADIPINSEQQRGEYDRTGTATGGVGAPDMEITVSDDRDGVGEPMSLNALEGSVRNDFVRITHSENIKRTVQIPIHSDYWKPFPREDLKSLDEGHTATLEPVKIDGEVYSMVTVTFDGAESAVFPIPEDAVASYSVAASTENRTNETFGVNLGLTPTPWKTIPPEVFANETTVRIEGNPDKIMIQFNAGTPEDPEWAPIPSRERASVPVYRMERDGVDNAVYVVSSSADAPAIRYKKESNPRDKWGGWATDAKRLLPEVGDTFGVDIPLTTLGPTGNTAVSGGGH